MAKTAESGQVMGDLRKAIEQVLLASRGQSDDNLSLTLVSRSSLQELKNQYNLFFVEPEDDKDWKEYQETG